MSRSGYSDDIDDNWALIRYRGAVKSAMQGARGQSFLKEMAQAMDALPQRRLGANDMIDDNGSVCALGAVAWARGLDLTDIDPDNAPEVARIFGIAESMAREIVFENDENGWLYDPSPSVRFQRMRRWVKASIVEAVEK